MTLSVLLALGHYEEFKLHLAGALRNGWTHDELTEAIIHIACYAGWPAAVQGFRAAADVFGQPPDTDGPTGAHGSGAAAPSSRKKRPAGEGR